MQQRQQGFVGMHLTVAYTSDTSPICSGPHAQFGVLPDTPLNDLSNMLQSRTILLDLVVAQGYVVGQLRLISQSIHCCGEQLSGAFMVALLVQQACGTKCAIRAASRQLLQQPFAACKQTV